MMKYKARVRKQNRLLYNIVCALTWRAAGNTYNSHSVEVIYEPIFKPRTYVKCSACHGSRDIRLMNWKVLACAKKQCARL
jgi:hypothetical protein